MKIKLLLLSIIATSFFCSCNNLTLVEPTIEKIEDVDIKEMSKERIDMDANLIINNPNGVALDLASANLDVIVDEIVIANIIQTVDAKMPAQSEFKMPVKITMDLAKLYKDNPLAALGKGLQIMSDKKLDVQLKGNIKAGKGMAKLTVDVDQIETVRF